MEFLDTHYVETPDGAYIAYQVFGDGPIDVLCQLDWPGNIDFARELPIDAAFYDELATFARVILHDRRGVGLSSRNVAVPNLETRVADTLSVLDAVRSNHPVLVGLNESGSPNLLLAATRPERVHSLVWVDPIPRFAWAPDYPWGRTPDDLERELSQIDLWGTEAYGRIFVQDEAEHGNPPIFSTQLESRYFARAGRNACTPDVARALSKVWYDTDVRGVLPSVQVPSLIIMAHGDERAIHVASLLPAAEVREVPGGSWTADGGRWLAEEIRRSVGIEPPPLELDTILSTVLFTDIVDSTQHQVRLGDHGWKDLVERHHAVVRDALTRWKGVENDTAGDGFYATFDGPARAIRCAQEAVERVRDLGIEIRAGVHTGECEVIDGKIGGLSVTIGARVAAEASRSEVLVSQTVKDLTAGSGLTYENAGEHDLKGVPDRWHLYRVVS